MSADCSTLQCHRCAGYFQVAAERHQRVRCPHCECAATAAKFREVPPGEVAPLPGQMGGAPDSSVNLAALWVEKGKHLQFGCPHCQRPMRMLREEAGGLADCPHCGLEIIAPDPASGAGPRLSDASQRSLGNLSNLKPRTAPGSGARATVENLFEPAAPGGGGTTFEPFGKAAEPEKTPPKPVRTLGLEQLGSAFQARDEVEAPQQHEWDNATAASSPAVDRVPTESRGRLFALTGAILLLLLGAMFVFLELRRRGGESAQPSGELAAAGSTETAVDPEHAAAFEVARKILAAENWRAMLPMVRSKERVGPLMEAYYRERELAPFAPTEFENPIQVDAAGLDYLQLRVRNAAGDERLVAFERTAGGEYLFDWEFWVDIAQLEWETFIAERPSEPRVLRVTLARSSPLDRYVEDAGLARGEARGLRVWLDDSTAPLYAVLPTSGEGANAVWEETSWELGRRVVAELSFPVGAAETDRVSVHRVLHGRWLRQ